MLQHKKKFSVSLLALVFCSMPLFAQDFSIDGNRWYEIEISIFSNQIPGVGNAEQNIPRNMQLTYPDAIIELSTISSSLMIDFADPEEVIDEIEEDVEGVLPSVYDIPPLELEVPLEVLEPIILEGPEYSPGTDDFHVADITVDPFIALGEEFHQFNEINQELVSSFRHQLLYHKVWRQPVLNKVQTAAIFVRGGEDFGEHSELEGSVSISFNVNRVDIDANLWRTTFSRELNPASQASTSPLQVINPRTQVIVEPTQQLSFSSQEIIPDIQDLDPTILEITPVTQDVAPIEWQLPLAPYSNENTNEKNIVSIASDIEIDSETDFILVIDDVANLQEVRSMISNSLHYLDHPAFGLLVEVRPYQLPVPDGLEQDL